MAPIFNQTMQLHMIQHPGISKSRALLSIVVGACALFGIGLATLMALSSFGDALASVLSWDFEDSDIFEALSVPWVASGVLALWGLSRQAWRWVSQVRVDRPLVVRTVLAVGTHLGITIALLPEAPVLGWAQGVALVFTLFLAQHQLRNKDEFSLEPLSKTASLQVRRAVTMLVALVCVPAMGISALFGVSMAFDTGDEPLSDLLIAAGWLGVTVVLFVLLGKATLQWRSGATPRLWQTATSLVLAAIALWVALPESLVLAPPAAWALFLSGWTVHAKFRAKP